MRFDLLDVPGGGLVAICVDVYASDFGAFLQQAMPVVESFAFRV